MHLGGLFSAFITTCTNTHERSHTVARVLCTSVEKLLSWETEDYDTAFRIVDNDL
jgi:hypothetical protein